PVPPIFGSVEAPRPRTPPAVPVKPPAEEMPPARSNRTIAPRPRRAPYAVAKPMSGITIDGRLDDWPQGLDSYPIDHQLIGYSGYDSKPRGENPDPHAYFLVGYDLQAQLIYLAAVVRDEDLVVHPADARRTDAVEVYIDGTFGDRKFNRIEE